VTAQTPAATTAANRVLVPLLVGSAVAVSLGAYGSVHDPTGETISTLGFSGMINMKAWLTTGAAALALVQLATALRLFGHLGSGPAPRWVSVLHRSSGTVAVLLSVPVAYHCLWSLGFATYDTRVVVHSLLGCAFYGAFVAKLLSLKMRRLPGWALPVFGGLTFSVLVGLWLSSSLWFFRTVGFPEF
jgi:heme/copper-type cytochrome/quinol oxidase subunit 4